MTLRTDLRGIRRRLAGMARDNCPLCRVERIGIREVAAAPRPAARPPTPCERCGRAKTISTIVIVRPGIPVG